MLSSLPQSPREHQRWENILRSLSRHKGGQVFARIDWGVSRALGYLAHVTLSPQRWAFLPSCGSHYHGGTHSWSTYCLLRGRLPPAGPGCCPLEKAAAWECGWGPPGAVAAGQRLQCGAAGVLSPAQTHDWMSENAAHYPTHRAQRGHAGAQQARRPGWVHGGSGSPPQRARMCP